MDDSTVYVQKYTLCTLQSLNCSLRPKALQISQHQVLVIVYLNDLSIWKKVNSKSNRDRNDFYHFDSFLIDNMENGDF